MLSSLSLSFNDAYLSIDNNSVIGYYYLRVHECPCSQSNHRIQENTSGATAFQFVDAAGITSTTSSFHAYPFLNVSDQLALVGPSGFLQIQDYFTYPAQPLPSYPTALQTGGWIVSPGFSTELTNGTLRYLSYEPLDGVTQSAWIAIPRGNGSWDIRWYDGSVIITQDWVGISIIVVESDVASS